MQTTESRREKWKWDQARQMAGGKLNVVYCMTETHSKQYLINTRKLYLMMIQLTSYF